MTIGGPGHDYSPIPPQLLSPHLAGVVLLSPLSTTNEGNCPMVNTHTRDVCAQMQ